MKKKYALIILTCFFTIQKLSSSPIISLFFRSYHEVFQMPLSDERIKNPGKLAQHTAEWLLDHQITQGIVAVYAGYMEVSNGHGQISFPRKHTAPTMHIIVTPAIIPIMAAGNTVHHWEFDRNTPATVYRYNRLQGEFFTEIHWHVTVEEIPNDRVIPADALVIFANPADIVIKTGDFPTNDSENLLLPDLFVKKGIKVNETALYFLTVTHFFRPIGSRIQTTPLSKTILLNF